MDRQTRAKINCSANYTLELLGGKWKFRIIWQLAQQDCVRFNELGRRLKGISPVVLTQNLQELQDDKIVNRVQYNEIPPKVEYSLTELGLQLIPVFEAMGSWGDRARERDTQEE